MASVSVGYRPAVWVERKEFREVSD